MSGEKDHDQIIKSPQMVVEEHSDANDVSIDENTNFEQQNFDYKPEVLETNLNDEAQNNENEPSLQISEKGSLSYHSVISSKKKEQNSLGKRSDKDLNLSDEIQKLKDLLMVKTIEYNNLKTFFNDVPNNLESLKNFPEFYNSTVQNKFLQLKPEVVELDNYKPSENQDNPKVGPYLYREEGCVYEGQYYKQNRHGVGKALYKNGSFYQGTWRNDLFDGFGLFIKKDGTYIIGEYKKGQINGQAKYCFENGDYYSGNWVCNKKHGIGKEIIDEGTNYEGTFENGLKTGKDCTVTFEKKVYLGNVKEDLLEGII